MTDVRPRPAATSPLHRHRVRSELQYDCAFYFPHKKHIRVFCSGPTPVAVYLLGGHSRWTRYAPDTKPHRRPPRDCVAPGLRTPRFLLASKH